MRRILFVLAACWLAPSIAQAGDGNVIESQSGPSFGSYTKTWRLIDAARATDNGKWVYYGGFSSASIEVTGISGDTVTINCTNGLAPANDSVAGTVLATITANGYSTIGQPCRYIKAAVTVFGAGTISVTLTATTTGGGAGGAGSSGAAADILTTTPGAAARGEVTRPFCGATSAGVDTSDTVLSTCKTTVANAISLTAPTVSTTDPYTHRVAKRIVSATTTAILAGVAAQQIRIYGGSVCVDAAGVTTVITLEDNAGSPIDIVSGTTTLTPYQLAPGQCLDLTPPAVGTFFGNPTTTAQQLQIITAQAGPVNVSVYLRRE